MAEILSSLTLTQLGILLALVFLMTILVLLALLWYLRRARHNRVAEMGGNALADVMSSSPIVLGRAASSGQLSVEIDGHTYTSLDQVTDAGERRRIVRSAVDLARFSGLVKIALPDEPPLTEWREEMRAVVPVAVEPTDEGASALGTEAPAPENSGDSPAVSPTPADLQEPVSSVDAAPPPFPEPALSEAELGMAAPQEPSRSSAGSSTPLAAGDQAEEAFLTKLRDAQMAPKAKKSLASLVPRPVRAENDQPFVVQIERILQRRWRELGLDEPVHIRVNGEGVLRVQWEGTLYDSPGDVPDETIRNLIRDSVGEWESTGA